jgi:hypothetical protein
MTFFPILLWKNIKSQNIIKYAAIHGIPDMDERRQKHLNRIRSRTRLLTLMILVPVALFWATIVASLENTPLTGRYVAPLPSIKVQYVIQIANALQP